MEVSAGETAEVEIHGISSQGAGVGTLPEGRVVFVHRTAPGDRARVRVTEKKGSWARGRLEALLDPSEIRREAPCPHYDRCGGCTLEHLTYDAQLRWKGRIVADAMERIGDLPIEVPEVRPSPDEFRYRSRITVTLRRLEGDRVVAGFHEVDEPGRIVDLGGECLLPVEPVARALDGLRDAWGPGAARLPEGRELRLTLRHVEEGVLLLVEGGRGRGEPEALLEAVPDLVAVWRMGEKGPRHLAGAEEGRVEWLDEAVPVRSGAFLQVNRAAAEPLHRAVLDVLRPAAGRTVVDAYAGVGSVGRILAREGARVTAIELDREAVAAARRDAPDGFRAVRGRVEEELAGTLPADVVLVNPPRTGLHDRIPEILGETPPGRLIYVSCDPATLARDRARLAPAFRLEELGAFDLFPQTAHVECVAVFRGDGGAGP